MSQKTKSTIKKSTHISIIFSLIMFILIVVASFLNISFSPPKVDIQETHEAKAAGESWYANSGTWNYRKKITIDRTKVADVTNPSITYANFPLLVSITGLSNVNANGSDIRFTMANGITEIPREIESYDSGNLEAWVKLTLTKDAGDITNDVIYMYYGNSSATEPLASSEFGKDNVWSNTGAVGIWLFNETEGDYAYDSSSYGSDFASCTGRWGEGGLMFTGDTISLDASTIQKQLGITDEMSVIIKLNVTSEHPDFYETFISMETQPFFIRRYSNSSYQGRVATISESTYVSNNIALAGLNEHHIITFTAESGAQRLYVNGNDKESALITGELGVSPSNLIIGDIIGNIDYIHIYNIARSAEWVLTEYNNRNNDSLFLAFTTETSLPCAGQGGMCKADTCSIYVDCAPLLGACGTSNCCSGTCTDDTVSPTIPANLS
ncbi:MAG: DUF2341 domain-containing protein, partial [Candidatus Pacebacteria bacterium]|nr:DUF2341 domain-containing protein [Candidatus Paceibacterota bacterium]